MEMPRGEGGNIRRTMPALRLVLPIVISVLLNLRVEHVNITAAHGDDQIAGLPVGAKICLRIVKRGRIVHAFAGGGDGIHQHGGMDIPRILFPCGKNIRDQNFVSQVAAVDVILKKRFDTGIGVRLHHRPEAVVRLTRGVFKRAVHFRGIVPIIGVKAHTRRPCPVNSKRRCGAEKRERDWATASGRMPTCTQAAMVAQRMHDIEFSRNTQRGMRHACPFKGKIKGSASRAVISKILRTPLAGRAKAVCHGAARLQGKQIAHPRIIPVADARATLWKQTAKADKGAKNIVEILIIIMLVE